MLEEDLITKASCLFKGIINNTIKINDIDPKLLNKIKECLDFNNVSEEAYEVKVAFAKILYEEFTNEELTSYLNNNNKNKYYILLKTYQNYPYKKYLELFCFISNMIYFPEEFNSCDASRINWFLEACGYSHIDNLDKLQLLWKKRTIVKASPYDTLKKEIERYNIINKKNINIYPDDFIEFANSIDEEEIAQVDEEDIIEWITQKYKNKKLGNIGELIVYNDFPDSDKVILVSSEFGDGYGFDIYMISDNSSKETLIEVKTTTKKDKDEFRLSRNEASVMEEIIDSDNSNYYVYKVYYDADKNESFYHRYKAIDTKTFIDIDNDEKYVFDEKRKYVFKLKRT